MEHLNKNDVIRFVTANEINEDMLKFFSKVNGHMRVCPDCRKRVDDALHYYDRLRFKEAKNTDTETSPELNQDYDLFAEIEL